MSGTASVRFEPLVDLLWFGVMITNCTHRVAVTSDCRSIRILHLCARYAEIGAAEQGFEFRMFALRFSA